MWMSAATSSDLIRQRPPPPSGPSTVLIGTLVSRLSGAGVAINLFVVSDHGMAPVSEEIYLADYADFSGVRVVTTGTDVKIYSTDKAKLDAIYQRLEGQGP